MSQRQETPVLNVTELVVEHPAARGKKVHAVSGVTLRVMPGETLGLVGESGCGKSSLARAIMQLPPPTSGSVAIDGLELTTLHPRILRDVRARFQMIFQDPVASLNPVRRVGGSVEAPLRNIQAVSSEERQQRVREMLEAVGLDPGIYAGRMPFQLSGGQCQRVAIARALMTKPRLLICDEPVSALDVSIQAQILNLLRGLRRSHNLSMLFISHDLAVVKNVSDRVAVMYLGRLCEAGPTEDIFAAPLHPYTRALLDAVPDPDAGPAGCREPLSGELPSPLDPPSGCRFRTRCPRATELCAERCPEMREVTPGREVACHFPIYLHSESPPLRKGGACEEGRSR